MLLVHFYTLRSNSWKDFSGVFAAAAAAAGADGVRLGRAVGLLAASGDCEPSSDVIGDDA